MVGRERHLIRPSRSPGYGNGDPLLRSIQAIVGASHVLTDPDLTASFEVDWTRRWSGRARMVVQPGSPGEVAEVVGVCASTGASVVPQGGNTGLVGGGVPRGGEVVINLRRLKEVGVLDATAAHLTVGAGVTLSEAQKRARSQGFDVGVDLAARDSATIGGMLATNAGGVHGLRYGDMRANTVGVEAVLADGSVVSRLGGLSKDNVGYDLTGLLVGSEGTLGVITRAVLRLVPRLVYRAVALIGLPSTEVALGLLSELRRSLESLEAVEIFYPDGMRLVRELGRLPDPLRGAAPGAYMLVECAGRRDPVDDLAATLERWPSVAGTAIATDARGMEALWGYRERHTEAISRIGIPHKMDVVVPLSQVGHFVAEVAQRVEDTSTGAKTILFGHLGEGSLHVNVVGPDPNDYSVDEVVLAFAAELGGSISAEHGVGVAKGAMVGLRRSEADMRAMAAVKAALDPQGLLNPGVLFPSTQLPSTQLPSTR